MPSGPKFAYFLARGSDSANCREADSASAGRTIAADVGGGAAEANGAAGEGSCDEIVASRPWR